MRSHTKTSLAPAIVVRNRLRYSTELPFQSPQCIWTGILTPVWIRLLWTLYIYICLYACIYIYVISCTNHLLTYFRLYSNTLKISLSRKKILQSTLFLAATKQLYEWFSPSARLSVGTSVCPSLCHTFFNHVSSSYHHENYSSYYQCQKWYPCKRSRSEVKGQGHRGTNPLSGFRTITLVWMMTWCTQQYLA